MSIGVNWAEIWAPVWKQVWVSALVQVPDVVGDSQAAGTATLQGAGFVVAVDTAFSSIVAAGDIISQSPTGGSQAGAGSTVTITVSLGEAPPSSSTGAGRKRRRRRKLLVEIDGRDFEVESVEQAVALLDRAKEMAVKQIAQERAAPLRIAPGTTRPAIKRPSIRTRSPDLAPLVRQKRAEIIALYDSLLRDLEIRALLIQAQEDDDEQALLRLL